MTNSTIWKNGIPVSKMISYNGIKEIQGPAKWNRVVRMLAKLGIKSAYDHNLGGVYIAPVAGIYQINLYGHGSIVKVDRGDVIESSTPMSVTKIV